MKVGTRFRPVLTTLSLQHMGSPLPPWLLHLDRRRVSNVLPNCMVEGKQSHMITEVQFLNASVTCVPSRWGRYVDTTHVFCKFHPCIRYLAADHEHQRDIPQAKVRFLVVAFLPGDQLLLLIVSDARR